LKKIILGIMLMLLAVYSSTTILKANSATSASIVISPDTTASPSGMFMLNMTINNVVDMYGWTVTLVYPQIITMTGVNTINGTAFTDGDGFAFFNQTAYNSTYFQTYVARTLLNDEPGGRPGVTGSGLVAQLEFEAISIGTAPISCTYYEIVNSQDVDITPITVPAVLAIITVAVPVTPVTPKTVGGTSFSLANAASPPTIDLASIAIIAAFATIATTIYFKGIKRRKEKQ